MKSISIIFVIAIATTASISYGQIHASSVNIQSKFIPIENTYHYYNHGEFDQKENVIASFSLIVDSGIITNFDTMTYQYSARLHDISGDSTFYTNHTQNFTIQIDTDKHQIVYIMANSIAELHDYAPDLREYWERPTQKLLLNNIPYHVSNSGSVLFARIEGSDLRKITGDFISYYSENHSATTATLFASQKIQDIPDNAYIEITITGNFPLSVILISNAKSISISIDPSSKILKLSSPYSNQSQPLTCFDLLGRKHNLEFLGTDGTASTYSVRSLRSGVYFVSDGKEMVKFMITE